LILRFCVYVCLLSYCSLLYLLPIFFFLFFFFFFFNDPATTEIYTLSLHDALPISGGPFRRCCRWPARRSAGDSASGCPCRGRRRDRKSTRLNSSHLVISYAVFCLKKKKKKK